MTDALDSKRQERIARTLTSAAMRANVGRRLAEPALLVRPGQMLLAAPAIRVLAAADDADAEDGRSMNWRPERRRRRSGQRVALRSVRGAILTNLVASPSAGRVSMADDAAMIIAGGGVAHFPPEGPSGSLPIRPRRRPSVRLWRPPQRHGRAATRAPIGRGGAPTGTATPSPHGLGASTILAGKM
jgi:hypothetical protein